MIAIKGNGTPEMGKSIIESLEAAGAINEYNHTGCSTLIYAIDSTDNTITICSEVPEFCKEFHIENGILIDKKDFLKNFQLSKN